VLALLYWLHSRMQQCIAVCCNVLRCVAVCSPSGDDTASVEVREVDYIVLVTVEGGAVCCSMLQYVAVCQTGGDDIASVEVRDVYSIVLVTDKGKAVCYSVR